MIVARFLDQRLALAMAILALAAAPLFAGSFTISLLNDIGIATLVVLGLVLLSGIGGVTSFGHAAFVGVAAYTSAWLTTEMAVTPWLGLLAALGTTVLSALVIGLLTLRLGGHYLPMSTIAWGMAVPLLFGNIAALGRHSGLSGIAPISLGEWHLMRPEAVFYVIWTVVLLVAIFSRNLLSSREGRAIRAVRGGEVMMASFGASIFRLRLMLFILSAIFAALAGWLYAHANRFVSPAPFALNVSVDYNFMMIVGGLNQLVGAFAGSAVVIALRNYLQDILPLFTQYAAQIQSVAFSTIFILLLHHARGGVVSLANALIPSGSVPASMGMPVPDTVDAFPLPKRDLPQKGSPVLNVQNATKRFGGLIAVDRVSFELNAGEMLGLIGPNGAGKSTMFNLVTGTMHLTDGRVAFNGQDVTGMPQSRIALMGMARTFQHVKLRPRMSVVDNVALGAHARGRCGLFRAGLNLDREEEYRILSEARTQIARIGFTGQEQAAAGSLPLGSQRMVEIARALASDPSLLILDEPAAGLRKPEKKVLADLLRRLRDEGVTIMIVEHDMDFVMKLVDRIVVMNFGTKLFDGAPEAARADKEVRAAYLGDAA